MSDTTIHLKQKALWDDGPVIVSAAQTGPVGLTSFEPQVSAGTRAFASFLFVLARVITLATRRGEAGLLPPVAAQSLA